MANRPRWKARLIFAFVGLVPLLALVAILLPALRSARQAAVASQHTMDLMQIGLAVHNFHDTYHRLPPAVRTDKAGRPLSSWRFQILPFVEAIMMEVHYDDRWDDPANRWLSSSPFHVYCWSSGKGLPESLHTNVVAITGPGTAFDGDRVIRPRDLDSDTILAIGIADSGIHWMEPGDLPIDQVPESITQGVEGYGVHVLFADGSVWMLRPDVPLEDLKKFFTIEGAKRYDRDEVLGPGLVHLRGLPRLEELSLDHTSLADADLQYLAGLDSLLVLLLGGNGGGVSD